jgi:hypothetical protein
MSTTTRTKAEIQKEIANLEKIEVHVATNQGTYGGNDAARKIGSGRPAHANREVYETVAGRVRTTGPGEDAAPGRMRQINGRQLTDYRRQVAALRAELRQAR